MRYARQRCARAALKRDAAAWMREALEGDGESASLEHLAEGRSLVARLTTGAAPVREACVSSRCQIAILRKGEAKWSFVAHGARYEWGEADAYRVSVEARGDKVRFLPCPDDID